MSTSNQPFTSLDSKAAWLDTLTGARIRVRTAGEETDDRATVIEFIEPARSKPPVFTRHEFVEVFCVLEGALTFQFMDELRFKIAEGHSVTCPAWKPHSFWNETDEPVTVLLVCTPAGLDNFFIESHNLLSKAREEGIVGEAHQASMKELRTLYGLEHVGHPPDPGG